MYNMLLRGDLIRLDPAIQQGPCDLVLALALALALARGAVDERISRIQRERTKQLGTTIENRLKECAMPRGGIIAWPRYVSTDLHNRAGELL